VYHVSIRFANEGCHPPHDSHLDSAADDPGCEAIELAGTHARVGEWTVGGGWRQRKGKCTPPDAVLGLPAKASLRAPIPESPVFLLYASGQARRVNAQALRSYAHVGGDHVDAFRHNGDDRAPAAVV